MLNFDKYDSKKFEADRWYRAMVILTEAKKHDIEMFNTLVSGRKLPKLADVDDYFVGVKKIAEQTGISTKYLNWAARKICDEYCDVITDGFARWGFKNAKEAAEYMACGGRVDKFIRTWGKFKEKVLKYMRSEEWKAMEAKRGEYLEESMSDARTTTVEYYNEPLSNFDYETLDRIGDIGDKDQKIRYLLMQLYRHHITEYVKLIPHGAPKDVRKLETMLISEDLESAIRELYPTIVKHLDEMDLYGGQYIC